MVTLTNTTSVVTQFGGNQVKTDLTMEMELSQTVQGSLSDGSALVNQKLSRIKMVATGGGLGATLSYDSSESADSAELSPLSAGLAPLVGAEFEVKFNSRGAVLDVTPPKALIEKLSANQATAGIAQMFNGDAFKTMLSQSSIVLPEEAVSAGDKWETKVESNLQLGGAAVTISYEYAGTVEVEGKDLEQLDVKMVVSLLDSKLPDAPKLQIKRQTSSGTMYFDNTTGLMSHSELQQMMQIETVIGQNTLLQQTTTNLKTKVK